MQKLLLFAMLIAGAFYACKKETTTEQNSELTPQTKSLIERTKQGKNAIDADDANVSRRLLALSLALRDAFKESDFTNEILHKVDKTASKTTPIQWFYDHNENVKNAIDQNFESYFKSLAPTAEPSVKSTNPLNPIVRNDASHAIGFYVLNADWMDASKTPIFSSNEYISANDEILGWQLNSEGEWEDIVLNEEIVSLTDNPIIVMDLSAGVNEEKLADFLNFTTNYNRSHHQPLESKTMRGIASNRYRLNRDLDNGDDEFCIVVAGLDNSDVAHLFLQDNGGFFLNWKKIDDISNANMGVDLYKWFGIYGNTNIPNYTTTNVYYNLFERDWNYSSKFQGKGQRFVGGNIVYLYGNTRFIGESVMYLAGTETNLVFLPTVPTISINNNWLWQGISPQGFSELDWWRID